MFFSSAFGNRFFGDFFLFFSSLNLDFCAHSQCFRAFSQNRWFFKKQQKNIDFGSVFGGPSGEKSRKNCVEKHAFFRYRFFSVFLRFLKILPGFWKAPGFQKIGKKNRKNQFSNAFSFEGGFWEGSGTVLGRFWEDFEGVLDGF